MNSANSNYVFVATEELIDATNTAANVVYMGNISLNDWCPLQSPSTNSPPQDVFSVTEGGKAALYVAYGSDGILRFNPTAGVYSCNTGGGTTPGTTIAGTWTTVSPVSSDCGSSSNSFWNSLTGYRTTISGTSTTVIWAACSVAPASPNVGYLYGALWRLTYAAGTIAQSDTGCYPGAVNCSNSSTFTSTIDDDTSKPDWWHTTTAGTGYKSNPQAGLSHYSYIPSEVTLIPGTGDAGLLAAGTAGVWDTVDATDGTPSDLAATSSITFAPAVTGLASTVDHQIAADRVCPSTCQNVLVTDTDWKALISSMGFSGTGTSAQPLESYTPGLANGASATPLVAASFQSTSSYATTYLIGGILDSSSTSGDDQIWYSGTDPFNPGSVSDVWSTIPTPDTSHDVIGLAIGKPATSPVLIAVEQGARGSGVWQGTGCTFSASYVLDCSSGVTWTASTLSGGGSSTIGQSNKNNRVSIVWPQPRTNGDVFLYDPHTGLWASSDAGASWTLQSAYSVAVPSALGIDAAHSGYMEGYNSTRLGYVLAISWGEELTVLIHAECLVTTCTGGVTTVRYDSGAFYGAGPVTLAQSIPAAFVARTSEGIAAASGGGPVELCEMSLKSTDMGSFYKASVSSSDGLYDAFELTPNDLAAQVGDADLYASNDGQGVGVIGINQPAAAARYASS